MEISMASTDSVKVLVVGDSGNSSNSIMPAYTVFILLQTKHFVQN